MKLFPNYSSKIRKELMVNLFLIKKYINQLIMKLQILLIRYQKYIKDLLLDSLNYNPCQNPVLYSLQMLLTVKLLSSLIT